jgi:hypothetical protein
MGASFQIVGALRNDIYSWFDVTQRVFCARPDSDTPSFILIDMGALPGLFSCWCIAQGYLRMVCSDTSFLAPALTLTSLAEIRVSTLL